MNDGIPCDEWVDEWMDDGRLGAFVFFYFSFRVSSGRACFSWILGLFGFDFDFGEGGGEMGRDGLGFWVGCGEDGEEGGEEVRTERGAKE